MLELEVSESGSTMVSDRREYGQDRITFEKQTDRSSFIYWCIRDEPDDLTEFVLDIAGEDFGETDPSSIDEEYVREDIEAGRNDRYLSLDNEDYGLDIHEGDSEVLFFFPEDSNPEESKLQELMQKTVDEAERAYDEATKFIETDIETLREQANGRINLGS